ncbi:MAG: cystathionine gamma-synthase family protein [Pseudomonadota bacterium]
MKQGFTTTILHSDRRQTIEHGAVHKPVHISVPYAFEDPEDLIKIFQGEKSGYVYGRQGNPTNSALEAKINAMEGGVATACFSTGMAAISAVFLALFRANDHIIASAYIFGNTNSFFGTLSAFGCEITFVDATQVENVEAALRPNTRAVFVETIANPCTQIADLEKIGELCATNNLIYIVDNTLTSPYLFQASTVKASLIINSLTKYIAGHGNALGGAVTDTGHYNWQTFPHIYENYQRGDSALWGITQIRKKGARDIGATLSAEAAHRIAVGAETLALRMNRICGNALELAVFFTAHPGVQKVYYPGLVAHAQHKLAKRIFKSYGGLISIELAEGLNKIDFLKKLNTVICSSHLGDTRTLAIPVADTIYWEMGAERRQSMGINDSLIRLSVGIEDIEDLLKDFNHALMV